MLPIIQATKTFTANETDNDLLSDYPLNQYADAFAMVQVAFNVSAANVQISINTGSSMVCERLVPLVKSTAPIFPDDFLVTFAIGPGERIQIKAEEVSGATPTMLWAMRVFPSR